MRRVSLPTNIMRMGEAGSFVLADEINAFSESVTVNTNDVYNPGQRSGRKMHGAGMSPCRSLMKNYNQKSSRRSGKILIPAQPMSLTSIPSNSSGNPLNLLMNT